MEELSASQKAKLKMSACVNLFSDDVGAFVPHFVVT